MSIATCCVDIWSFNLSALENNHIGFGSFERDAKNWEKVCAWRKRKSYVNLKPPNQYHSTSKFKTLAARCKESVLLSVADGRRPGVRLPPSRAAPRELRIHFVPRAAPRPQTADRVAPAGAATQPLLPRQGNARIAMHRTRPLALFAS